MCTVSWILYKHNIAYLNLKRAIIKGSIHDLNWKINIRILLFWEYFIISFSICLLSNILFFTYTRLSVIILASHKDSFFIVAIAFVYIIFIFQNRKKLTFPLLPQYQTNINRMSERKKKYHKIAILLFREKAKDLAVIKLN